MLLTGQSTEQRQTSGITSARSPRVDAKEALAESILDVLTRKRFEKPQCAIFPTTCTVLECAAPFSVADKAINMSCL